MEGYVIVILVLWAQGFQDKPNGGQSNVNNID